MLIHILLLTLSFQLLSKELLVGINERNIYRYQQNGAWAGIDVELIQAAAQHAGYKIEIIAMPWARVLESLKDGKIDVTLAAANSSERSQYAHFSNHNFRASHYVLFVRKEKLPLFSNVKSLADIIDTNASIGALRGAIYSTEHYALLKSTEFQKKIVLIDNDQSLPLLALKGRVDGYIDSDIEGKHYLSNSLTNQQKIVPLITINQGAQSNTHLMFSKKTVSEVMVKQFDEALYNIHKTGLYNSIIEKYSLLPGQ